MIAVKPRQIIVQKVDGSQDYYPLAVEAEPSSCAVVQSHKNEGYYFTHFYVFGFCCLYAASRTDSLLDWLFRSFQLAWLWFFEKFNIWAIFSSLQVSAWDCKCVQSILSRRPDCLAPQLKGSEMKWPEWKGVSANVDAKRAALRFSQTTCTSSFVSVIRS